MIPKKIHYCWFGHGEMPDSAKQCIASWHNTMPDWEYKLWNEENFDINAWDYCKEAYHAKKYAFVSDVARLYALYTEGGVYMDVDVFSIKPFNDLMSLSGFIGFEGSKNKPIGTGIIGTSINSKWAKEQLDLYQKEHFILANGTQNIKTNTLRITEQMKTNGLICNGDYQIYKDIHIFPSDYFCPRQTTGEYLLTKNTYCDHQFLSSWTINKKGIKQKILSLLGKKLSIVLIKTKRRLFD